MDTRDQFIQGERRKLNFLLYALLITLILFAGYVIRDRMEGCHIKPHEVEHNDLRYKLRHHYVQFTSGHWVYCHAVYTDGTFAYTDEENHKMVGRIADLIDISDDPLGQ